MGLCCSGGLPDKGEPSGARTFLRSGYQEQAPPLSGPQFPQLYSRVHAVIFQAVAFPLDLGGRARAGQGTGPVKSSFPLALWESILSE